MTLGKRVHNSKSKISVSDIRYSVFAPVNAHIKNKPIPALPQIYLYSLISRDTTVSIMREVNKSPF